MPLAATTSDFPFSTREPEVYQGDFYVTNGPMENRWFIARNGEKWRFDVFRNNARAFTQLRTDKLYSINHRLKIYAVNAQNEASGLEALSSGITTSFFSGKEYREFDDLGNEGNVRKYRVRDNPSSKTDILIYIDSASGLIVRQEFNSRDDESGIPFIFEIRNLKLEADNAVFDIPAGYIKASWDEYRVLIDKNK